jgi:hypothetical protein
VLEFSSQKSEEEGKNGRIKECKKDGGSGYRLLVTGGMADSAY